MQTCRKLQPLLRISRQSFKAKSLSNLVDLEQARKLRAPRLIPLTYEESGNAAEYLNRGVESFQNGFPMEGRVQDNPATMTTKQEFPLPSVIGDAEEFTTGAKPVLKYQQENMSENDGTKAQKLLSGTLLSSYLLCLLIYPHCYHIFQ